MDVAQNPPSPNEVNEAGQAAIGLGLSGTMLVGFLFILALMFFIPMALAWHRKRRERYASTAREIAETPTRP